MLFNSYPFLFAYLPVVLSLFLVVRLLGSWAVRLLLGGASVYFYFAWNPVYIWLLLGSVLFNYSCGLFIQSAKDTGRHGLRTIVYYFGIIGNLGCLGYFKYADFFLTNLGSIVPQHTAMLNVVLPLGISFFSFTQIAYLADIHKSSRAESDLTRYLLFVTFFPHLVAGPILRHDQILPQFGTRLARRPLADDLAIGLTLFVLGLAKKVLLADQLQPYASGLFDTANHHPMLIESWRGTIAYTLELYFDFSGYSDMAIGLARCFGIIFPFNFNSPYRSTNIIDFWRRWHMTLSAFLRDYLYIPLGGNRGGLGRWFNLLATMLLGGLWHGAGWTFVVWGGIHAIYLIMNHLWRRAQTRYRAPELAPFLGGTLTFLAVSVAWVFFRAHGLPDALHILAGLGGMNGIEPAGLGCGAGNGSGHKGECLYHMPISLLWILGATLWVFLLPNSQTVMGLAEPEQTEGVHNHRLANPRWQPTLRWAILSAILLGLAVSNLHLTSQFLYYQF